MTDANRKSNFESRDNNINMKLRILSKIEMKAKEWDPDATHRMIEFDNRTKIKSWINETNNAPKTVGT
jgi:hypothetical protein